MNIQIDGVEVSVGDYVWFKSDIEQAGEVVSIKKRDFGGYDLVLKNECGFDGAYTGGSTSTTVNSKDCWVD